MEPFYEDRRCVDLISDMLPFGWLWYTKPDDAIGHAMHGSRSHRAVIRVYDAAGNVIDGCCMTARMFRFVQRYREL